MNNERIGVVIAVLGEGGIGLEVANREGMGVVIAVLG